MLILGIILFYLPHFLGRALYSLPPLWQCLIYDSISLYCAPHVLCQAGPLCQGSGLDMAQLSGWAGLARADTSRGLGLLAIYTHRRFWLLELIVKQVFRVYNRFDGPANRYYLDICWNIFVNFDDFLIRHIVLILMIFLLNILLERKTLGQMIWLMLKKRVSRCFKSLDEIDEVSDAGWFDRHTEACFTGEADGLVWGPKVISLSLHTTIQSM